jgi:hypothetical protein
MVSPTVAFIEMGADSLKSVPDYIAKSQRKELGEFGNTRAQAIGASALNEDFAIGYYLGLATARAMISTNPELLIKPGLINSIL